MGGVHRGPLPNRARAVRGDTAACDVLPDRNPDERVPDAALLVSHGRPGFYFRVIEDPCTHPLGPRASGRSCRLRAAISRFTGIRSIRACWNLRKRATFPSDGRAGPWCATPARADSSMEQSTIGPIRSNSHPRATCLSVARNPGATWSSTSEGVQVESRMPDFRCRDLLIVRLLARR